MCGSPPGSWLPTPYSAYSVSLAPSPSWNIPQPLSIACIVGLASRAKWAYGLALLFAAAGLVLGLAGHLSPAAIVINGMIVLLLAPAFRVYFPKRSEPAQDFLDRMPPSSDVPPPME